MEEWEPPKSLTASLRCWEFILGALLYFRCPCSLGPLESGLAVTFCYSQLKASLLISTPEDSRGEGLFPLYPLGVVQELFGCIKCHATIVQLSILISGA